MVFDADSTMPGKVDCRYLCYSVVKVLRCGKGSEMYQRIDCNSRIRLRSGLFLLSLLVLNTDSPVGIMVDSRVQ